MATAYEPTSSAENLPYEAELAAWRQEIDAKLRVENSWLTLTGLYWLHEGENSIGSDPVLDVYLPASAPLHLGFIDFRDHQATLRVTTSTVDVTIDGAPVTAALLRDDYDPQGLTRVVIGPVNFHVIKRGDLYGIRVRDNQNPARQTFGGRRWFPIDPAYCVSAIYTPYPEPRELATDTAAGIDIPMESPGFADLTLNGQPIRLEAFAGHEPGEIWFVFRETSPQTYHAGRFLYATVGADNSVILDFNKAYNPPCAFTPYATCPLPPRANILAFPVEVGERAPEL